MNVTEVLHEVGKLAREERAQVVERINKLNDAEDLPQTDDERRRVLYGRLMAQGLLKKIPPRLGKPPELLNFKPLVVEGKPVSETIIEERR